MTNWPNRRSGFAYKAVCVLIVALSVLTVISMALSFGPSPVIITKDESALSRAFPPQAIGAAIGAIGLTGVVFGWLIARAEDYICGTRFAELVQTIYPFFFKSYLLLFIPMALIGIWAGKADFIWPTFFAFLTVVCHVGVLIRVCYVFVIRSDCRERLAFFYYECILQTAQDRDEIGGVLLKTADYTHMLLRKEHRNGAIDDLIAFWIGGLKRLIDSNSVISWEQAKKRYWREIPDDIMGGIALSRSMWETLLQGENDPRSRGQVIAPILEVLSEDEGSLEVCCILVGLMQSMFDTYFGHEKDLVWEVRSLCNGIQREINRELILILAVMLLVYRLQEQEDAEEALKRLYIRMHSELMESVQILRIDPRANSVERDGWLMLYAEWFIRYTLKMDMHCYMIMLSDEFVDDTQQKNRLFSLDEVGYHLKMLVWILEQIIELE